MSTTESPRQPSPPRRVTLSAVVGSIQTLNPGDTVEIVNDTEETCTVWCGRGEFARMMTIRSEITTDDESARIAELEQERDGLRSILDDVEWGLTGECPSCGEFEDDGHEEGCSLVKALIRAEGETS